MKQYFKSVYFSDYPTEDSKEKSITIAFSEPEKPIYQKVKHLSNEEIRSLIGVQGYLDLSEKAESEDRKVTKYMKVQLKKNIHKLDISAKDVTFSSSKKAPFSRWYPYIEGYSIDFVKHLITNYCADAKHIYEPFAGTGTTLFAADELKLKSYFSEVNPLLHFITKTKIAVLQAKRADRLQLGIRLGKIAADIVANIEDYEEDVVLKNNYEKVFDKSQYFEKDVFSDVLKLGSFAQYLKMENELLSDCFTIGVLASFIPISLLKKAGDVRFKTAKELAKGQVLWTDLLPQKLKEMAEDVKYFSLSLSNVPEYLLSNAKKIQFVNNLKIDALITSPPYLNGTNYFRNTKLELWFLRYLQNKEDLRFFRDKALTSGINDVRKNNQSKLSIDIVQYSDLLEKTLVDLEKVAYDARITVMCRRYFEEMYEVFEGLRKHLQPKAKILIDIGDSIFAGVHVQTDMILIEIFEKLGFPLLEKKLLRKRRSRNKTVLSQTLLVFDYQELQNKNCEEVELKNPFWKKDWQNFKTELPHQQQPFSKRNWGHSNHSLCSYQGKLKPAIAYHLVKTFVPEKGRIFDPFSGVGTIPFEAALAGKKSYGMDISLPAYYISSAKVHLCKATECDLYIDQLHNFLQKNQITDKELLEVQNFGLNKTIAEYYEPQTLSEILLARRFFQLFPPTTPSHKLVISSMLHILHGNRPYALSRRSHPITPYAPKGDFEYKSVIEKLKQKTGKSLGATLPPNFVNGSIFYHDTTNVWPQSINDLDAIITSPPFFDSTRFYAANWLRIWFTGWSKSDFKSQSPAFVEEKQKKSFEVYKSIFRQSRERLKTDGVLVLHLGKSKKCDMAAELQKISTRWFDKADLLDESVVHCESHGIRDKGTVTAHQYLVLS